MASAGEPEEVECLAAERDEDQGLGREAETGPELLEMHVDLGEMPPGFAVLPTIEPEFRGHWGKVVSGE